jgi:hypothetical protein
MKLSSKTGKEATHTSVIRYLMIRAMSFSEKLEHFSHISRLHILKYKDIFAN